MKSLPVVYRFGHFTFCPEDQVLSTRTEKGIESIELDPKESEVLKVLVMNPGRLVTKDEIMQEVWGANPVEESNIAKNVHLLRRELGGALEEWIKTVSGRGYKFVQEVKEGWGVVGRDGEEKEEGEEAGRRDGDSQHPQLRAATFYQLWKQGLTTTQMVEATMAIDYEEVAGLDEVSEGTKNQWIDVVNHSPDNLMLLVHEGEEDEKHKIVGYWHFQAIEEEITKELEAGTFEDSMLLPDKVRVLCSLGEYELYFVMFVVRLPFRGFKANRLLYDALIGRVLEMEEAGVKVKRIWANPFTPEGIALCKTFGLKKVREHVRQGAIYAGELPDFIGRGKRKD